VTPNPGAQIKNASEEAPITFGYNTSNGALTTGIGLRVHFNANQLTLTSVTEILPSDGSLFAMGPSTVDDDTADQDGDIATNKVFLMAWVHTGSGFPGLPLPKDLFTANFTTAAGFSGSTTVRVTAIDTALGYGFASSAATITHPAAVPTPTPTVTPTPTPGATPTPTPTATPGESVLDIDNDGDTLPFTDGLLVLRYLIGFRNDDLVNGVVNVNGCVDRCTALPIQTYIDSILVPLDIDNDGDTLPFTDGLLVLRYLIGFRNDDLVNGVVNLDGCVDRCTALPIQTYIQGLIDGP
jgi:hypothetical protein